MKTCNQCGQSKLAAEFRQHRDACRKCEYASQAERNKARKHGPLKIMKRKKLLLAALKVWELQKGCG